MTWWSPMRVLQFAREAGFDNDAAQKAATIALVASSGADHDAWETEGVPGTAQRGLWAIPESLVAEVNGGDQSAPARSAATAYALYHRYGRKWSWHPVVAVDGGAMCKRTLDALTLDKHWVSSPKVTHGMINDLRSFRYQSERIKRILSQYPSS
jgi:hypothetical protein